MKIFVINLEKESKRRYNMSKKFNFFDIEFFEASDGNLLEEVVVSNIQKSVSNLTNGKITNLSIGEIGCADSHLRVYKHIVDNAIPLSLILEDDVDLTARGRLLINKIINKGLPPNIDLLLLGYSVDAKRYDKSANLSLFHIKFLYNQLYGVPTERLYGSYGYILTMKGAKMLLGYGLPIKMQADILLGNSMNGDLVNYAISKPCIIPDVDNNLSTIGERVDSYMTLPRKGDSLFKKVNIIIPISIKKILVDIILAFKNKSKTIRIFHINPWKYYLDEF
jgi:glycosyl transferase family 25